jgi:manganese/iron transport system permease protein
VMLVAVVLAAASAVAGLYGSFYLNVPSGPAIVLIETALFVVALALGPRTGLLASRSGRVAGSTLPG